MVSVTQDALRSKVTFVTLTKNAEPYIRRNLESLRMQKYEPREIWVVDGGSTDRTLEIAGGLADRVLTVEPGMGIARERARKASDSEYLFYLDGDKFLTDQEAVSKLVSKLEKNPGLAACQAMWAVDTDSLKHSMVARVEQFRYRRFYGKVADKTTRYITPGATAFRASALQRIGGFRSDLKETEDSDISLRLIDAGYDLMVTSAVVATHYWNESFTQLLAKAFRSGREYYHIWRSSTKSAWPFMASSNPFHAIVRGIKMGVAALTETRDVVLSSFVVVQVSSYYTFFFTGFLVQVVAGRLGLGQRSSS
jgi:glycosyltransferase involved in cell wall biosynthesis